MLKYDFIILLVTIFGGGACIYYGVENQQPFLTGLGFLSSGAGLCLNGIGDIIRKEVTEVIDDEYGRSVTYSGLSAVLLGIFWCIGGATAICAGIAILAGQQEALPVWIKAHPGAWMIPGGLACAAFSGHIMLGAREERSGCWAVLGSLPKRIFGLILIAAGLGLAVLGALGLAAPEVFNSFLNRFRPDMSIYE